MTTEIKMAENGEFLREYGKQYFVVASEALNIGRVKWNMVPIGKKGQGDITFYLTTEQMLALCYDILNGVFVKKLAADTASYPSAYRYVTGEDGCLHLNIGGGKMGCRIQMQDANAKTNYIMAVSLEAMSTMARKYMINTGMTPVSPNSYYASIIAAFEAGRAERSKFRKNAPEGLTDVVDSNTLIDESAETKEDVVDQDQVNNKIDENANEAPAETKKPKSDSEVKNFKLTISGQKTLKKGFYSFAGTDGDGAAITLLFRKEDAERLNWFEKFESKAASEGTTLTISGERTNEYILYKGPAKK